MTVAIHHKDRRDGLWNKCKACNEFVFKQALERNLHICPFCNYYFPMPAESRLRHLLDTDPLTNLYPLSAPKPLLESLGLADLVSQTEFPDSPSQMIAAGEGTISDQPTILVIVHPYAPPQRVHFVTLLVAIRVACQKTLPLITIYPSDALPKSREVDRPIHSELSFTEITYLTTEMERLSQAHLPQITVLTETNVAALSTKFPLGDLVFAEWGKARKGKLGNRTNASGKRVQLPNLSDNPQPDVFIDCYVQRPDLPIMLGKLLGFFAKR